MEPLLRWLEELRGASPWLEKLLPKLLPLLEHVGPLALGLVAIVVGAVVSVIITSVLLAGVIKFAASNAFSLAKHELFPQITTIACAFVPIVAAYKTAGPVFALGAVPGYVIAAVTFHPKLVELRDNQRKKDIDANAKPAKTVVSSDSPQTPPTSPANATASPELQRLLGPAKAPAKAPTKATPAKAPAKSPAKANAPAKKAAKRTD